MSVLSRLWLARWLHWRQWRWRTWLFLAFVGVALVGASVFPHVLRREIVNALAKNTPATVQVESVRLNPFHGRLTLNGLSLSLPGEEQSVVRIDRLTGSARLLELLRGALAIDEIRLSGVHLTVVRQADGALNLSQLVSPSRPDDPPPADLPQLTIRRASMSDVVINYHDRARVPVTAAQLSLQEITTEAIALAPRGLAAPIELHIRGTFENGPVQSSARVFWSRAETKVDATLEVQQTPLRALEPYVRETLTLSKLSGHAHAQLQYRFQSTHGSPTVHTLDGTVRLAEASVADPASGHTMARLQSGLLTLEQVDLLTRELRLSSVTFTAPKIDTVRTPAGLNVLSILKSNPAVVPQESHPSTSEAGWRVAVQEINARQGELSYRDSTWPDNEALQLTLDDAQLQHISSMLTESPFRFRARNGDGVISGEGKVQFSPLGVQARLQFTDVALSSFQPLLVHTGQVKGVSGKLNGELHTVVTMQDEKPAVTVNGVLDTSAFAAAGLPAPENTLTWDTSHIEVREGSSLSPLRMDVAAQLTKLALQRLPQGDVSIEKVESALQLTPRGNAAQSQDLQTASLPESTPTPVELDVKGTFTAQGFLVAQGPDQQELLSCYRASGRVKEGSRLLPVDLHFADVTLEYPYAQGFRTTAGQFQLAKPVSTTAPPSTGTEGTNAPEMPVETPTQPEALPLAVSPLVHIDRVALIGGQLYFEDHAVAPLQTIYWQDIRVDLSDVGYPLARPAAFALHAFNMDGAPIEISGVTERRKDQLVTSVNGAIERLTLSRFNAYLAPLLGYRVRKGAVSVKWRLMMPGDLVRASAAVTFHDLGLSAKQSTSDLEQQIGLPMSLVIALLKDLDGNINLQLPVEGRWNEPGFRLGGTVWRAMRDVLIGAVTSPLKLLGAIFKGEDQLENFFLEPIPFVPGTSQASPAGKEQVNRLRVFLTQRPELDVQLTSAIGAADRAVLRDRLLLTQLSGPAPPPPPPHAENSAPEQPVTPEEEVRRFLLRRLEQGEGQSAPLSEPAATLLKKLRDQTVVASPLLEQLARERTQAVMTALTENLGVAAERLHPSAEKIRGRGAPEVQYMIQAREEGKKK
jgi:hypothetical protein